MQESQYLIEMAQEAQHGVHRRLLIEQKVGHRQLDEQATRTRNPICWQKKGVREPQYGISLVYEYLAVFDRGRKGGQGPRNGHGIDHRDLLAEVLVTDYSRGQHLVVRLRELPAVRLCQAKKKRFKCF